MHTQTSSWLLCVWSSQAPGLTHPTGAQHVLDLPPRVWGGGGGVGCWRSPAGQRHGLQGLVSAKAIIANFEGTKGMGLRGDAGASEIRNRCPPGNLPCPHPCARDLALRPSHPSPAQRHCMRGSAQVPSERKTEVGFCLTRSHGAVLWDKGLTLREHAEKAGAGPLTIPLSQA